MPYFVDIGGTPANEPCAQLGQTPNFDVLNKLEVLAYKYAIIARYGSPPAGCRLTGLSNRHDFGRYVSLVLHVENELVTDVWIVLNPAKLTHWLPLPRTDEGHDDD